MFNLFPREDKFLILLQELEGYSHESAGLLKVLVHQRQDIVLIQKTVDAIHLCKRNAKIALEKLSQEICRTLITPFDREDLQQFALVLYQIPKRIEKIATRLLMHDIHSFHGDFEQFTQLIERQAEAMYTVLQEFTGKLNTRTINAKAAVLHELEDQGDIVLSQLVYKAFQDIPDIRELILRKDLYEMLENITDLYRDAADVALQVILKHT